MILVCAFVLQQLLQRNTKSLETGSHSCTVISQTLLCLFHIKGSCNYAPSLSINDGKGMAKLRRLHYTP